MRWAHVPADRFVQLNKDFCRSTGFLPAPNLDELPSAIAICPCDCQNVGWIFLQSLCYARIALYMVPAFMGLTIWPQCWGMCLTFLPSKNSWIIHFSPDDWTTPSDRAPHEVSHSNMSARGILLQWNIGWLHLSTQYFSVTERHRS